MTTTRKYYDSLIESFSELNSIKSNDVIKFFEIKAKLNSLILRIQKFNLFTLSFSDDFFEIINKETIDDFFKEKLSLTSELFYELHECLWTTRLRYGGELMPYLVKINNCLLKLTIPELDFFEKIKKVPEHYSLPDKYIFKTETQKEEKKNELNNILRKHKVNKVKVKLTSKDYLKIESLLLKEVSFYKDYVYSNYPTICDSFHYFNKKIIAYVTQAISDDIFEFRIHSYLTKNGDNSTTLEHKYYDFYPAYFDNLEEITDKLFSASISILYKDSLNFESTFTTKYIHRELIRIFVSNAREEDIKKFVEFLLKCDGYHIILSGKYQYEFDIEAQKDGGNYFYEIFHHKPRSVKRILEKIQKLKETDPSFRIRFLFTSSPEQRTRKLLEENRISVILLDDLINKHFLVENSVLLHWYIKSSLSDLVIPNDSEDIHFVGENLISRLAKCPTGEKDWSTYEKIGIDIFKFLFSDNFKVYLAEEQVSNDLRNHRRDLLVSNNYRNSSSFWADVKHTYNANVIIIDFKNYTKKLNSDNLFNVSKYTKKNVGNFAIVFSRKGIDQTAKKEQFSLFQDNKLLIPFSDDELIDMVREKIIGKDPIDRLESKSFELAIRS